MIGIAAWVQWQQEQEKARMKPRFEKREPVTVHIRWMIRRDYAEVLQIERDSYTDGWSEDDFIRCLRERNTIGMVADVGCQLVGSVEEKVVGFFVYQLHKNRLEVLNMAVAPEYRGRTIGRQMLTKMIGKLFSHRRTRIRLEVRETNLAAQLFFRACGFEARRVLRGHYEDTGEDAYRFVFAIPAAGDAQPMATCEELP